MATSSWNDLIQNASEGPEPVPDGPYDVVVDTADGSKMTSTGKPQIAVKFKIINGPHQGKPLYNNFVLSQDNPNALGYFFQHMAALGVDQSYIAQCAPPEQGGMAQIAQAIIGKYATVDVGHRMWNGQNRNQVNGVKPYAGGGAPAPALAPAPQQAQPQPAPQQPAPAPAPAPAAPAPAPAPAPQPAPQPQIQTPAPPAPPF